MPQTHSKQHTTEKNVLGGRRFPTWPGLEKDNFLAFIKQGNLPEDYPGLCLGPVSPSEKFLKITEFTVPRKTRDDGDRVPCAMNSP